MVLSVVVSALAFGGAVKAPSKVVMKFGGSSVRDAERITEVCKLVESQISDGLKPHLVCSAMGKTTNNLLAAADFALENPTAADGGNEPLNAVKLLHAETAATLGLEDSPEYAEVKDLISECSRTLEGVALLGELSTRTRDKIVSYGERMSGRMVAANLCQIGVKAKQYESWDLGLTTSSTFGDASILDDCWPAVKKNVRAIKPGTVGVITGFIGKDTEGAITTLGRGGSDLTASMMAAAAGFDEAQVWKDVDGILSADPRVCERAIPVPRVSYSEAAELAYFGAQVLHPVAMQPAVKAGMPVRVKNSYNPSAEGTLITQDFTSKGLVSAITSKSNIVVVDISSTRMLGAYGFLSRVFDVFKNRKLSVDTVATSEVSVSLTLNKNVEILTKVQDGPINQRWAANIQDEALSGVVSDLSDIADIDVRNQRSIITLIANVAQSSNVMLVVFQVMQKLGVQVEMISQGASKVNISIVVDGKEEKRVIQALHKCFFEDECIADVPCDVTDSDE